MRKITTIIVTIITVLLLLASCGSDATRETAPPKEINYYDLYLDIECEQNFMFSTYDVEVYLDESRVGLIPHGKHFTRLIENVEEGSHELSFYKDGDHSVRTYSSFEVTQDCTFMTTLHTKKSDIEKKGTDIFPGIEGNSLEMISVVDDDLDDAINKLKQIGFSNITYEDDVWDQTNWVVTAQSIEPGSLIDKNEKIVLTLIKKGTQSEGGQSSEVNTQPEDSEEEQNTLEDSDTSTENTSVLTKENNADLASILDAEYLDPKAQESFAKKYSGRTIEFDCLVYDISKLEKNTRFSYILVPCGDTLDQMKASFFKIEDIGYYEFNLDKTNKPSSVDLGALLNMQATIVGYDDMYILISPVKTIFKGMVPADSSSSNKSNNNLKKDSTTANTDIDAYVATLASILKDSYGDSYLRYDHDENMYNFYFAFDGLAKAYTYSSQNKESIKTAEQSMDDLSALLLDQIKAVRKTTTHVTVYLLNDYDNSKVLYASLDGKKVMSALD